MSSTISFSFNPSSIPAEHQPAFMARFFQLVTEYQIVTSGFVTSDYVTSGFVTSGCVAPDFVAPYPDAPSADTLPMPTSFVAVDGDDTSVMGAAKKVRKNPWVDLSDEQKAERLAAMKRGRENKAAARKMSGDSLDVPAPSEPIEVVVVTEAVADNASDSSSTKKVRKNPWASLSPEEHAAKVAAMRAAREAKKAANANTSV